MPCVRQPRTLAVEIALQEGLPFAIEVGDVDGIGAWQPSAQGPDVLAAVAAWTIDPAEPDVWRCNTLAVATGFKRHGLGRRLALAVLGRARDGGARRVEAVVHKDNGPILDLHVSLGGRLIQDSDAIDYFLCVVAV